MQQATAWEICILMAGTLHVMDSDSRRLAVLIDGDSINPAHFGRVFAWATQCNDVIIRRIYGDHDKLEHWKECISNHGIESVPSYAKYKNTADIVLAVHAAEILYSNKEIGGFCIVTNDNDFAGLVKWIRDKGAYVAVVWSSSKEKHTPSFEDECNDFEYIDKLPPSDNPGSLRPEKTVRLERDGQGGRLYVRARRRLGPAVGRRKQTKGDWTRL